jgi:hypothetical protein
MMAPRKGIRLRRGRRKRPPSRLAEATARARADARTVKKREWEEAQMRRAMAWRTRREEIGVRLKGVALEARRRVRPFGSGLHAFLALIAPYVSQALLLMVRIPAALIATLLDLTQDLLGWLRARIGPVLAAIGELVSAVVTPLRTVALVGAAAAVALGISQFFDYRGVAVNAPAYRGEVGNVAPVPLTDTEPAGDAHLYLLLPVAVLALVLVWATYAGRWRLGRVVALLGVIGIAVSLVVDLPQGLHEGVAANSYSGTEAQLIEGFWAQMAASTVLVFAGLLLGFHARQASAGSEHHSRRRAASRRRRPGSVGPVAARGGAEP